MKTHLSLSLITTLILYSANPATAQNIVPVIAPNIFVADYSANTIVEIASGGVESTFASGLNNPFGIAFDNAGNLFVADDGTDNIYKYAPGGARSTIATVPNYPHGLACDTAGNLYVANFFGGSITKITPGGVQSTFATGLSGPNMICFDSQGNLFVADYYGGSVTKITPGGVKSTVVSGLSYVNVVAVNNAGDVFVGGGNPGGILEIAPGGARSTFATGLSNPAGMAFDAAGNLFVADAGSGIIYEYTPAGVRTTVATGFQQPIGIALRAAAPPTITCPDPLTLECTNGAAMGTVTVGVSDANGLPLEVIWTVDGIASQTNDIPSGGTSTSSNVTLTAIFGEGEHTVVVAASNGQTAPVSCSTTVTVSDTLPPEVLAISATPNTLWPPNHKMVPVSVDVDAIDNCDPSPVAQITQVTCNEPPEHFTPDWIITGPLSVDLRAERSGNTVRIYTLYVDVTDASGNKTTVTTTVTVPKSQSIFH